MPRTRRKQTRPRRTWQHKDWKKLAVVAYLRSRSEGDTTYGIKKNARLQTQEGTAFNGLMREMIRIKWIEKKDMENINGNVYYFVTERGQSALSEAKKLVCENTPLGDLELFQNVVDL